MKRGLKTRATAKDPGSESRVERSPPEKRRSINLGVPDGTEEFIVHVDLTRSERHIISTEEVDLDQKEYINPGRQDPLHPNFKTRDFPSRRDKTIREVGRAISACIFAVTGLIVVLWAIYRFEQGDDLNSVLTMLGSFVLIIIAVGAVVERYLKKK